MRTIRSIHCFRRFTKRATGFMSRVFRWPRRERRSGRMPRSLASAASPFMAGYLLGASSFGWPLVIAGVTKIVYDLLLYREFRQVRPPEERPGRC